MRHVVLGLNESAGDYSTWKRKNVTYRGVSSGDPEKSNTDMTGILGDGLYTAPSSNKSMAKQYGTLYFVVNARPSNPKVFNTMNDWEIWMQKNLLMKYSTRGYPDLREFNKNSTIEAEMQAMGFDGVEIKGREMVNYDPKNVKYFKTEDELKNYFNSL